jgi:hypothetical protein
MTDHNRKRASRIVWGMRKHVSASFIAEFFDINPCYVSLAQNASELCPIKSVNRIIKRGVIRRKSA